MGEFERSAEEQSRPKLKFAFLFLTPDDTAFSTLQLVDDRGRLWRVPKERCRVRCTRNCPRIRFPFSTKARLISRRIKSAGSCAYFSPSTRSVRQSGESASSIHFEKCRYVVFKEDSAARTTCADVALLAIGSRSSISLISTSQINRNTSSVKNLSLATANRSLSHALCRRR